MGFFRDVGTAVDSVFNTLFSFAAFHSIFLLGLSAAGHTAEVPVPRPCDLWPPAVRPVPSWHRCEATLHHRHTHRVPGLSSEAFCWKLALGGHLPILHLGTYEAKRLTEGSFWSLLCVSTSYLQSYTSSFTSQTGIPLKFNLLLKFLSTPLWLSNAFSLVAWLYGLFTFWQSICYFQKPMFPLWLLFLKMKV